MSLCRILVVLGTRPEAIKLLPVVDALRAQPGLSPITCSTGQHGALLDAVLAEWGAHCDLDLRVMAPGQSLSQLTARLLGATAEAIAHTRPDLVLVQGDTATAFAGAVAAHQAGLPVGHVEAGLRSGDLRNPWPEEFHRVAIDAVAALRFAPTEAAAANLRAEYGTGRVVVTGNTGIDALLAAARRLDTDPALAARVAASLPPPAPARRLLLVTAHRRENLGPPLAGICTAVAALAARGDVEIAWPLHPNPGVCDAVRARLDGLPRVHLLPPLSYLQTVMLMRRSSFLLTDSGGLQEEAPALGRPVLVLRNRTERPEIVAAGAAQLVGTQADDILGGATALLDDADRYAAMARPVFPYGDGRAAERIAAAIAAWALADSASLPAFVQAAAGQFCGVPA